MSPTEQVVNERLTDSIFRRYTSRLFLVWLVCLALHCIGFLIIVFVSVDRVEAIIPYLITGEHMIYLSIVFVAFNFIQKAVDSSKLDALAKIIEAARS